MNKLYKVALISYKSTLKIVIEVSYYPLLWLIFTCSHSKVPELMAITSLDVTYLENITLSYCTTPCLQGLLLYVVIPTDYYPTAAVVLCTHLSSWAPTVNESEEHETA